MLLCCYIGWYDIFSPFVSVLFVQNQQFFSQKFGEEGTSLILRSFLIFFCLILSVRSITNINCYLSNWKFNRSLICENYNFLSSCHSLFKHDFLFSFFLCGQMNLNGIDQLYTLKRQFIAFCIGRVSRLRTRYQMNKSISINKLS